MLNKLKLIFLVLVASSLSWLNAEVILERFDEPETRGEISQGAIIDPQGGLERGALVVNGNGENMQYFYSCELAAEPGETYALALNYKTSAEFPNSGFLAIITFTPEKGQPAPASIYFRMSRMYLRWAHSRFNFTMPEGTRKARVLLRLAGVPESGQVRVDHLRLAPVVDGKAKGIDITDFETDFDQWKFDRHLIFDHFMPGAGASIENEWRKAKVGEAFFQAVGSGEPMQYALYIDNITLLPQRNYIFEAWLNASKSFIYPGNGMLIFFYKDANGKAIGQSRYQIRPTDGEWKEFTHTFTAPENCAMLDIGLNMRNMQKNDIIQLDHLRFREGADNLSLRYDIDPDTRKMSVTSYLTGNINQDDLTSLNYLINRNGQTLQTVSGQRAGETEIDLEPIDDGEYQLLVQGTFKDGKKMASDPVIFGVYNHPDWLNDIGLRKPADPAPAPWRNLQLDGQQIRTWNNLFSFNDTLQLQKLADNDGQHPVLATPMSLTFNQLDILNGGEKTSWTAANSQISGTRTIANDDFECRITTNVDYIGFMHYRMDFSARRDFTLNQGTLTLKVNDVDFIHRNDGTWTEVGAVDLNRTPEWTSKHFYFLQFGNLNRGICFYTPKLWPAVTDFVQDWVKARKDGELTLQLINAPLELRQDGRFTLEFALCPYPFRPAENNWKKIRFRAGKNSNCDLLWQSVSFLKYAGSLLEISDEQAARNFLKNKVEYQLVYQIPTYIIETIPQWSYFRKTWRGLPARAYDMRESHGGMMPKGDYRQRTWTDLYIKKMAENLQKYNWDGVYYDCFGIEAFHQDGEMVMPIFAARAFQERVYLTQRLNNPKSFTISHMGAEQANPLGSFSNVVLMGEQYRANFSHHRYFLDFMTLEEFRYENVVNIGPDRMLLPQYRRAEDVNSPVLTTHFMGMALAHNLMVYPNFIVKEVELRFRDRQFAFGMHDAEFFPYWLPNPDGLATSDTKVVVSYYKNPKGIFAIVLNTANEPVEFTLNCSTPRTGEFYEPVQDKTSPWLPATRLRLEPYLAALLTLK